ncbi:unnamed protein product, partial [Polarella glacialis]
SEYPVRDNAPAVPKGPTSNHGSAKTPSAQQDLQAHQRAKERSEVADLERHLDALQSQSSPQASPRLSRSKSFCDAENRFKHSPELAEQRSFREPGGFRRQFLHTAAEAEGRPWAARPAAWRNTLMQSIRSGSATMLFFEGLPDDNGPFVRAFSEEAIPRPPSGEGMSNLGVAVTVFKGNVGAAILFAPRSFSIGGWAASLAAFTGMFLFAVLCALRLLACALQHSGTYGELVEKSLGRSGRNACCVAIIMLQMGYCSLYFIFMSQVLVEVFFPSMPLPAAIALISVSLFPMSMVRKVSKLWLANLVGTICAAVGVFCVIGMVGQEAVANDGSWEDRTVAKSSVMLTLGSASFMFEGIGLVIPTFESSREPQRFPLIFVSVMLLIWMMVISVGLLGYLAYGDGVQPNILLNFEGGPVINSIRLLLAFAMFASFPLQLLPAVRLVEGVFFTPASNPTLARKCQKNAFRAGCVAILGLVAILGSTSLDSFVSLVGAAFGGPLAFVFPLACHYQLVAQGRFEKGVDLILGFAGVVLTIVVSALSIASWF